MRYGNRQPIGAKWARRQAANATPKVRITFLDFRDYKTVAGFFNLMPDWKESLLG
jgi:hypothetical protein